MRPFLALGVLGLLLVSAAPAPTASASPEHLLTDDRGDAVLDAGAGAPGVPASTGGQTDAADLVALDAGEDEESLVVTLAVASMQGTVGSEYFIDFSWRDSDYRVDARHSGSALGSFDNAVLLLSNGAGDYERIAVLSMTVDTSKATIEVVVPKIFILDGGHHAPTRGDALTRIHVASLANVFRFSITGDESSGVHDAMPNQGEGASLAIQMGDLAQGHLSLRTADRVRVSNGGATTFVFSATIANNATYEDEVDLALSDLPPDWNGTVQSPVRVPPGGEKPVTVLMSVPFAHKHGGFDSFNLTATTSRDASSRATLRFGVLHTPIPQPAGHHSELYLHAQNANGGVFATTFPFTFGYFNTEATHEGEADGVNANTFSDAPGWSLPLNPGLRMGIDFDLNRTGEVGGSILAHMNGGGSVAAKLYLVKERSQQNQSSRASTNDGIVLADAKAVKVTWDLQKSTPFKLTLTPTPDADYIPYRAGQNLVLVVRMTSDSPCCISFGGQTSPSLTTKDFKMVLPLNEYNDQLTGLAESASALDLKAIGPVEKAGRPGSILTYVFDLTNGGKDSVVQLDVAGNDAKLGTIVPTGRLPLAAGESHRITMAVHIPGDAPPGKDLEVLLFAHAQDDPSKMAIARTKTMVTTGANATDDETGILLAAREAEHKSPGLGALAILAGAASVGLLLRRRSGR